MRRRNFLIGGLAALLTVEKISCSKNEKIVVNPPQTAGNIQTVESIRKEGREYLFEFFKEYIPFMQVHSKEIRENAVTHGGTEGLARVYVEVHGKCLDLAAESFEKKVSDDEVKNLGKHLAEFQGRESVRTYIDYSHRDVVKGYEEFTEERVRFFREVIKRGVGNKAENFKDLLRKVFSKDEFKREIESYLERTDELYRGFAHSLRDYKGGDNSVKIFGPIIVWSTKEKNDEFYREEVKRIYGK